MLCWSVQSMDGHRIARKGNFSTCQLGRVFLYQSVEASVPQADLRSAGRAPCIQLLTATRLDMSKGTRFVSVVLPLVALYLLALFHLVPFPLLSTKHADQILPVVS